MEVVATSPDADGLQVWEGRYKQSSEWKQVVVVNGLERHYEDKVVADVKGAAPGNLEAPPSELSEPAKATSKHSRSKWRWIIGLTLILLLIVAIATPVGVVVSRNRRSPANVAEASSNGAASSPVSSTNADSGGVLKGTRLTTLETRTGGDLDLFYQNADGALHYISQSKERIWQGSFDLNVSDAKIGTPLCSTYSNWKDGTVYWWLFYVDRASVIQNLYSQGDPTTWRRGNVGDKGYKVPDQSNIAFTVSRGRRYNDTKGDLLGGLSLYTSDEEGSFREYIYADADESWSDGHAFPPNTRGLGPATLFSETRDAYLFNVNSRNALQMWWRRYDNDTDPLVADDSTWHLGSTAAASVSSSGSICGQYDFAFQGSNGKIQGSNFTNGDSPGDKRWGVTYDISNSSAIDGSGLSCWYFFPKGNSKNTRFHVFYQEEGSEIIEAVRHWTSDNETVPGVWSYQTVPIG
ncbi:MAG: hypothetical protein Q9224_003174 [Gallowayella concinna]